MDEQQEPGAEAPRIAPKFEELPSRDALDKARKSAEAAGRILPSWLISKEDVFEWYNVQKELERIKKNELLLRLKVFKALFPNPREGVNSYPLTEGWVLKADHTLNRGIDEPVLDAMKSSVDPVDGKNVFQKHGIDVGPLVRYKPELAKAKYNELTAEQQALFDRVLTIKPGSPQVSIALPAKNRPKADT